MYGSGTNFAFKYIKKAKIASSLQIVLIREKQCEIITCYPNTWSMAAYKMKETGADSNPWLEQSTKNAS